MRQRYPSVPVEVLQAVSERQASLVLGLALRNRDILKETIFKEAIHCDFSPKGWLHIATNENEEQGLCDEVTLAAQHGQRIGIWSRAKIADEFGIDAAFLGRFIPGDGTYHPFKYVCGELRGALRDGVALYTRTKVRSIVSSDTHVHRIRTSRGEITTRFDSTLASGTIGIRAENASTTLRLLVVSARPMDRCRLTATP